MRDESPAPANALGILREEDMTEAKKYLVELINRQPDTSTTDDIVKALAVDLVIRRNKDAERFGVRESLVEQPSWRRNLRRH